MLRTAAIKIIRHLGVVGECNIQYALNPDTSEYCVIEVNARLSRSSALASKATGYPLAYVAAKLALGYDLSKLRNSITKAAPPRRRPLQFLTHSTPGMSQETTACFEPALDYVVVKFPRWDTKKFTNVDPHIGSAMKSVGEALVPNPRGTETPDTPNPLPAAQVMSIGRSFEESIQKAVRMVDDSRPGITARDDFEARPRTLDLAALSPLRRSPRWKDISKDELETALRKPTDMRFHYIATAYVRGYTVDQLHEITRIDRWFLAKLLNIHKMEDSMKGVKVTALDYDTMLHAKRLGFSDRHLSMVTGAKFNEVRNHRKALGVLPVVKQVPFFFFSPAARNTRKP